MLTMPNIAVTKAGVKHACVLRFQPMGGRSNSQLQFRWGRWQADKFPPKELSRDSPQTQTNSAPDTEEKLPFSDEKYSQSSPRESELPKIERMVQGCHDPEFTLKCCPSSSLGPSSAPQVQWTLQFQALGCVLERKHSSPDLLIVVGDIEVLTVAPTASEAVRFQKRNYLGCHHHRNNSYRTAFLRKPSNVLWTCLTLI
jgi:hypothetical protein